MDILKDVISEKGGEIISSLTSQGFSAEQAKKFLGEAGGKVASAIDEGNGGSEAGGIEQMADSVIGRIDCASLASKVGIDAAMAKKGLSTLVPMLLAAMQEKTGDLAGILGMRAKHGFAEDLIEKVKRWF